MSNLNKSKVKSKKSLFNKKILIMLVGIICLYCLIVVGGTYAYLYMTSVDDETLTGNMATVDANLSVEKIVPTNDLKLVPLLDAALGNAVSGVGGTSSCIDSLGNLSCEVYEITIENTGTANLKLTADITLVVSGTNNAYNNLKWELLESPTERKSEYTTNGMETSLLDENLYLAVGEVKTYYIAVWISENDLDQRETDKGIYGGVVNFYAANGLGITTEFGSFDSD